MDLNDYKGIISAYNSLGLINQNLSDDTDTVYKNRALVYYKKALEMAKDQILDNLKQGRKDIFQAFKKDGEQ